MNDLQLPTRHVLPSVMMRSGTSKGLFVHRRDLPLSEKDWGTVLVSVMGSQHGDQRQLDGIGGGTSTTSKAAIVAKSSRPDADVDYTFAQVAVGNGKVDFSGNCGNMACGVGPFALDEGLVQAFPGQTSLDIRVFNTNTGRLLIQTVEVDAGGKFNEFGHYRIGGVKSEGSEIKVAFVKPAGSMTGKLLPTGNANDSITVRSIQSIGDFCVDASLVDAANPFIFVDAASLPAAYQMSTPAAPDNLEIIEAIRREGAVMYGLAENVEEAALVRGTPKIAVLSRSTSSSAKARSIRVQSYSMGKPHPSFQLTGAVCLSSAVCIEGTIANRLAAEGFILTPPGTPPIEARKDSSWSDMDSEIVNVNIKHTSGEIQAVVDMATSEAGEVEIEKVSVSRTARRLFEGKAYYSSEAFR